MKYSVIIPHENKRPEMLKEALESIASQTRKFDEIIEISKPKDTWEKINISVGASDCDAFVVLSDDDKLATTFLEETSEMMEKNGLDIVSTFLQNFGDDNTIHGPWDHPFMTTLTRRSIWKKVGGYDSSIGIAADADFWFRCQKAGAKRENLGKPLFLYRKHKNQWSNDKNAKWEDSKNKIIQRHSV